MEPVLSHREEAQRLSLFCDFASYGDTLFPTGVCIQEQEDQSVPSFDPTQGSLKGEGDSPRGRKKDIVFLLVAKRCGKSKLSPSVLDCASREEPPPDRW